MFHIAKRISSPAFKGYKKFILPDTRKSSRTQSTEPKRLTFTGSFVPRIDRITQQLSAEEKTKSASWIRKNQWDREVGVSWLREPEERTTQANSLGIGTLADED